MNSINEEKEELIRKTSTPGWMVIYGDMMSILLCFFVLLLSFSEMDVLKYKQLSGALRNGFGVQKEIPVFNLKQGTTLLRFGLTEKETEVELLKSIVRIVERSFGTDKWEKHRITLIEDDEGIRLRVPGRILFELGDATLKPGSLPFLDMLAELMRDLRFLVVVEGHTDDLPINTKYFHSNWDLSAIRASSVVNYFVEEKKLAADKFKVVGYAETRPLVPNNSSENRSKNRRVEFLFVKGTYNKTYPVLKPGDLVKQVLSEAGLKYE